MEFLFLGTSAGVPTLHRNVTALALVEPRSRQWFLVDCGEATQHQILKAPVSLAKLSAIFITHVHGDHCFGLPGLLSSAAMQGREAPLTIIAPKGVKQWLVATQKHTDLHLTFPLLFEPSEHYCGSLDQWRITSIPLSHRVPSFGYCFEEQVVDAELNIEKLKADGIPQGPLWGQVKTKPTFVFNHQTYKSIDYLNPLRAPRKFIVGGDNDTPDCLVSMTRGCQLLIHEATFTEDAIAKMGHTHGHSTAKSIAKFAEQAQIPNLILTHFSARYPSLNKTPVTHHPIYQEALAFYPGNLALAQDFASFRLNRDGSVISLT